MTSGLITLDRTPALDLSETHFEHVSNGIRVIGTWLMDEETKQAQPCLVLLHALRPVRPGRTIPCIVALDQAWRWTREKGEPEHVARQIAKWLTSGALPGHPANKRDVFAVMDAVQSRLHDLFKMPPLPVKAAIRHRVAPAVGEVEIIERDSGKTIHHAEVRGHVRD
ncbi:hypothetical protein [Paracoccus alkanivorans]|uniref:Uncharacterized protein n=1 Tax=Paracoccus alkanivorans TaxID=2116655 RepID=A0A3M0M7J7_9RHOB|nr:hypothetical protein [Paracoccus alkanivorans]RMC33752.1 hypothetical protein C9E81_15740 [Paracoccus alkanivorans]